MLSLLVPHFLEGKIQEWWDASHFFLAIGGTDGERNWINTDLPTRRDRPSKKILRLHLFLFILFYFYFFVVNHCIQF